MPTPTQVADAVRAILDGIYELRAPDGRDISEVFHRPPPTSLTDYYRVIKRPVALSNINSSIKHRKYRTINDFLGDVAQLVHNARTYNPPEHFIHQDALAIEKHVKSTVEAMVNSSPEFQDEGFSYPNLGYVNKQPMNGATPQDDLSDSDDSEASQAGSRRRRVSNRPVRQSVLYGRKRRFEEEEEERMADKGKRRGRPPTVDKPHEMTIKAVIRNVRKERDPRSNHLLCTEFEKLPDGKVYTDYYNVVKNPMALDTIRKKIKRREYETFEEFLKDMDLIFSNAKLYNDKSTQVYQDAVSLEQLTKASALEENKKLETQFQVADTNSRIPLDQVQHRGEVYRVGDWVHISNPNDPAKPIVGQIFRMWQENGETWTNACWYYRPEQTVHKYDKVFYENEVFKSGQYHDHIFDEVLEKCFVMFITKYQRGRPRGIGTRSVYCCESRYNESEKTFNKIRTWKACIPDEMRTTDYPMDQFERTKQLRRLASPIKHLLPDNAKETDPVPDPKMGAPNAPPVVGAVYKRPHDPADPPEQPTPMSPAPEAQRKSSPAVTSQSPATTPRHTPHPSTPLQNIQTPMYSLPSAPSTGAQPAAGPTAGPAAGCYVLSAPVTAELDPSGLANVAKHRTGQTLWFSGCPIFITHRVDYDPLPRSDLFSIGEPTTGLVCPRGFGHSAEYLAWVASRNM